MSHFLTFGKTSLVGEYWHNNVSPHLDVTRISWELGSSSRWSVVCRYFLGKQFGFLWIIYWPNFKVTKVNFVNIYHDLTRLAIFKRKWTRIIKDGVDTYPMFLALIFISLYFFAWKLLSELDLFTKSLQVSVGSQCTSYDMQ
jgi:hypothetical protein